MAKKREGLRARHSRACRTQTGGRCNCMPTWEANVWDARAGKQIRRSFPTQAEARSWRHDAIGQLRRGQLRAPENFTLCEAAETFVGQLESGEITNRSGDPYKPSVIRGYKHSLFVEREDGPGKVGVVYTLGHRKLTAITADDIQFLAERLSAIGLSPSAVRNQLLPLRVLFRRYRRIVPVNPTADLDLPAVRSKKRNIVSPERAQRLLDALPEAERALWATAFYAGLRRGELRALRWEDVDLAAGKIHVQRSWDDGPGEIAPKSRAGIRTVPILPVLADYLVEHKQRSDGQGVVFGTDGGAHPFTPTNIRRKANLAWKKAGLTSIGLHDARHTAASFFIAAGVNAKALSTYMGHSGIQITFDLYGHLMPGNEAEAAAQVHAWMSARQDAANAHSNAQTLETAQ
jgi:integrase